MRENGSLVRGNLVGFDKVHLVWFGKVFGATSVVDPNTLNLDPDPEFWPNLDPDPGSSRIRIQYGSGSTTLLNTFVVS